MAEHSASEDGTPGSSRNRTDDAVLAGNPTHTNADVRETYREQAGMMDKLNWLNRLLTGSYRRRLFGDASGRVLDVACGVGTNAQYVPEHCEYVGIDISSDVLARARQRVAGQDRDATLHEMDAQEMEFPDDSFDTVISSLSTCTFPDPVAALAEMGRVCRPDGRILLFEHGRSSVGPIARFQDWRADTHFEKHNCRWNQQPLAVVEHSPLAVEHHSSGFLGILSMIVARPE